MKIGIISALSAEIKNIISSCLDESVHHEVVAGVDVWTGTYAPDGLSSTELIIAQSGMGIVNAAATTQLLITKYNVGVVIFSGIAGGLHQDLRTGDVVIADTLKYIDTDTSLIAESTPFLEEFATNEHLVKVAQEAAEEIYKSTDTRVVVGTICSGNRFINTPSDVQNIKESTGAHAVEMEGAAIAHICAKNDIDFLIIRAISDNCDRDYDEFSAEQLDIEQYATQAAHLVLGVCTRICTS
jgi:adenosylhomocysteine nucleosidase